MAGQPMARQLAARVQEAGGLPEMCRRVADGASLRVLAEEFGVSRYYFGEWLNKQPGAKDLLAMARRSRAERWADETLEIADTVKEDPNAISKAKVRIDTRKWLAGVDDPDRYGEKKAQVSVSIGGMHLDALRRVQSEMRAAEARTIEGSVRDEGRGD